MVSTMQSIFKPEPRFILFGKKQFTKYAFAILVDSTDLLIGWIPIIGEIWDLIQVGIAYLLFKDSLFAFAGPAELGLPAVLDIFPTYTAMCIYGDLFVR